MLDRCRVNPTLSNPTLWLALCGLLLSACEAPSGTSDTFTSGPVPTLNPESAASAMGLTAPEVLLQVRQVNRNALRPQVLLDGSDPVPMQRTADNQWRGTVNVAAETRYQLDILWIESVGGRDLPLARFDTTFDSGTDGINLRLDSGRYDVSLDFDADGFTNLEERRNNTDPFKPDTDSAGGTGTPVPPGSGIDIDETDDTDDSDETDGADDPDTEVDPDGQSDDDVPADVTVLIPRVGERGAPRIDGLGVEFDSRGRLTGEWADAVQGQRDGTPLTINRLMIDRRAEGPDGSPFRRWAAMYDDDWLYLLVVVDDDGQREGDSFFHFDDDSLELFVDGDNSKQSTWGDDDDFQFVIPMLPRDAGSKTANTSEDGRFSRGLFSSTRRVELDFVTGPGTGPDGIRRPRFEQDVYELRLGLKRARIKPGEPFGIELQINDDDNGGGRDSKWGWFHPARQAIDIDFTNSNPSVMGTAVLLKQKR